MAYVSEQIWFSLAWCPARFAISLTTMPHTFMHSTMPKTIYTRLHILLYINTYIWNMKYGIIFEATCKITIRNDHSASVENNLNCIVWTKVWCIHLKHIQVSLYVTTKVSISNYLFTYIMWVGYVTISAFTHLPGMFLCTNNVLYGLNVLP